MTIRHVVMWKLATTDETERAAQASRIKAGLEALPASIPEIQSLEVQVNALLPGDNFDVVLISEFADEDALQRYAEAPTHQEVSAYIRTVVAGRAAVDARL